MTDRVPASGLVASSKPFQAPNRTMTLHLKVQPNAWPWLDQAAREVNFAWNWANETCRKAVQTYVGPAQWLRAYDLDALAAGCGSEFHRIGIDVVQRIHAELVTRRKQFRKVVLRFRASGGSRRALGWIPFKAANVRVKGNRLTFMGKSIRLFQMDRFLAFRAQGKIRSGNFAQNALGEWFLNVAVDAPYPEGTTFDAQGQPQMPVAPIEVLGIDLGLKAIVATSEGEVFAPNRSYRDAEKKLGQSQRAGHKKQTQRIHRKIKYQRLDRLHKLSRHLVSQAQQIHIGDVSLRFLAAGKRAKSAHDAAPGMLKAFLHYKGHWAGRSVHEVDETYTTQTCSACQARTGPKGSRGLRVRQWACTACGAVHERDVNAARLIQAAAPRCRRPNAGTR
jgi:IS605 OrfB family transposase